MQILKPCPRHRRSYSRKPRSDSAKLLSPLCACFAITLFLTCFLYLALSGFFYSPFVHPAPLHPLPWLGSMIGYGTFHTLCTDSNPNLISNISNPDRNNLIPNLDSNGMYPDISNANLPHKNAHKTRNLNTNTSRSIKRDHQFFLSAVIFNRVFGRDRFGVETYECRQWIEYMVYSGIEHIFWYDTAHNNAESQESYLSPYSKGGILTYTRFHRTFLDSVTKGFHFEQDTSYTHFLTHYKNITKWVIQIDVDEYPFSPRDRESCFLQRFIRDYERQKPDVTQILLQCMIFAGNPKGDRTNGWVIERYQRRKYETEGMVKGYESRQKPIYRADVCKSIIKENPHIVAMEDGSTVVADDKRMRLNHYWGARELGFTPDTIDSDEMLVHDPSIQYISSHIKQETGLVKKEKDMLGKFLRMVATS